MAIGIYKDNVFAYAYAINKPMIPVVKNRNIIWVIFPNAFIENQ